MADPVGLKTFVDAYGIAVRAGVLTPSMVDEEYFRTLFGLPLMSDDVKAFWESTEGVRKPITLAKDEDMEATLDETTEDKNEDTDEANQNTK